MNGFSLLWIVILVVAIIFEVRTNDVTAVWFMPAAVVALLLSFLIKEEDGFKNLALQIIAFAFVSFVSFLIFRISFNKKAKRVKKGKTNSYSDGISSLGCSSTKSKIFFERSICLADTML